MWSVPDRSASGRHARRVVALAAESEKLFLIVKLSALKLFLVVESFAGVGGRRERSTALWFSGLGFRVEGAAFKVQGSGCRVQGAEFRVCGLGCVV